MAVASITQTVQVTADAVVVNTENGTISDTKGFEEVTELPVNYRGATTSPLGVLVTVPGVQQDSNGALSINGGFPAILIDFTLDGISTINVRNNGANANMYPSSELLSEFRVSSVNNNAEFAQVGDVTVTTKSGSNEFHGSAFEYLQNAALDATVYGAIEKQAKVWNTFGASLGGPLILPKLYNGKDKTFFFMDYEGNRHQSSTLEQYSVPTASMRAGDLTDLPGGATVDPQTGAPFPNNQIPNAESVQRALSSTESTRCRTSTAAPHFRTTAPLFLRPLIPTATTFASITTSLQLSSYSDAGVGNDWTALRPTLLPSRTVNETDQNLILSYNYR